MGLFKRNRNTSEIHQLTLTASGAISRFKPADFSQNRSHHNGEISLHIGMPFLVAVAPCALRDTNFLFSELHIKLDQ